MKLTPFEYSFAEGLPNWGQIKLYGNLTDGVSKGFNIDLPTKTGNALRLQLVFHDQTNAILHVSSSEGAVIHPVQSFRVDFRPEKTFCLKIVTYHKYFQLKSNHRKLMQYPHYCPPRNIQKIQITGDIRISKIKFSRFIKGPNVCDAVSTSEIEAGPSSFIAQASQPATQYTIPPPNYEQAMSTEKA